MNIKHDKKKVIEKGLELFWTSGYHSLGVDQICKHTGMTKGAFYHAFNSKEGFLSHTLEAYGVLIEDLLITLISEKKGTTFKKIQHLYSTLLNAQLENNFKGCLVNNMMSEMANSNTKIAKITTLQFEKFKEVIEPYVKDAQLKGEIINSMDSNQMAELIHTTFFGFLTRSRSNKKTYAPLMISFLNTLKK